MIFVSATIVAAGLGIWLDRALQRAVPSTSMQMAPPKSPQIPVQRPYQIGEVDLAPQLLHGPAPDYPAALRRAGVAGTVKLDVVVDSTGRVRPGTITTVSSPDPELERAAVMYALGTRFRPGRLGGSSVAVVLRFHLVYAGGRVSPALAGGHR